MHGPCVKSSTLFLPVPVDYTAVSPYRVSSHLTDSGNPGNKRLHRASRTHADATNKGAAHRSPPSPSRADVAFRATPRIASHSPPTLLPPPVTTSSGTARQTEQKRERARSRAGGSTRQTSHRRFGRPPVCLRSPHRHRRPRGRMMGACQSSGNNEVGDQKKRSQMIDRTLEEDSKKLRRECKILLLGITPPVE